MADPTPNLELNSGTQASPAWTAVTPSGEVRWSDARRQNIASASWPYTTRPVSGTGTIDYLHYYTADATGDWCQGAAYLLASYLQCRWNWGAGTFASAPIITAYIDGTHGAITRGDNSILGGNTTDTGATARSYIKGNAYGQPAQVPGAAASNDAVVTDGATGALTPSSTSWLTNFQSLQGDADYILCGVTPSATQIWYFMLRCFMGANLAPGLYTPKISLKYTYT